jgi:predicted ATPase
LESLFRLAGQALAGGEYAAAATLARRQLALDRWREEAIRQLLHALAAGGKHAEALAEYEKARRLLAEELGVAPQPETIQLAEAIREGRLETRDWRLESNSHSLVSSPQSPVTSLHNLPLRLTSLLGRERELAELRGWLAEPETRLVTISGIGGVGKTRLALAVASSFIPHPSSLIPHPFPDGVWFVSLADLDGDHATPGKTADVDVGESFLAAVAAALGLTFAGPESLSRQLERSLRGRRLLLLLDNYEHQLSTRPVLLSLLQNAPGVRALVTSREQLNVGGEHVLALEGLPLPPAEAAASKDVLLAYSSARLFFDRAMERGTRLKLDEAERRSLIRICCLAEGLPLVIELAATWAGHFTCAEIATEMAANLDFLSTGSAARVDLPDRQRSPRAAFDYAWRLLSAAEQRTLAQLALLRGPFSREAAMTVTEARLVDLLSLVNKSLLRQTLPGWYAMHSLVRQFAREQLQQMETVEAAAKERHATYFLHVVAGSELTWYGPTPQQARADIRPVFENVRIAWQWAIQHHAWPQLDEALLSLISYYRSEGLLAEAVEVLRQLAARLHPPPATGSIEARLLSRALAYQAALLVRRDLRADTALEAAQAAVEWAQRAGDPLTQSLAAFARGSVLTLAATHLLLPPSDYGRIRESLEQAIAFACDVPATDSREQTRACVVEVLSLNALGYFFLLSGEQAKARECYEAALFICQTLGHLSGEGQTCNSIGELLENEGALEQALHYRTRAVRAYQQVNEPDSLSVSLGNLCGVLTYLGDYSRALQHGRAALELRQRHGLVSHFLYHRLALAAFHLGDQSQALQWVTAGLEETPLSLYTFHFRLLAGECYTRLARCAEAAEALKAALAMALERKNPLWVATAQRALADLALAQGDPAAAVGHVEGIVPLLGVVPLGSSHEQLRLYWTCYSTLQANNDPRASDILAAAHTLLQTQAALIEDAALRHSFLHQVAANREIGAERMKIKG